MTKTGTVSGKIRFPGLSFSGLFLQASCHVSQHCVWFAAVGDADSEDPDSQDGSPVSAGLLHHAGLRDRDWLLPAKGAERLEHVFGLHDRDQAVKCSLNRQILPNPATKKSLISSRTKQALLNERFDHSSILSSKDWTGNILLRHFAQQ